MKAQRAEDVINVPTCVKTEKGKKSEHNLLVCRHTASLEGSQETHKYWSPVERKLVARAGVTGRLFTDYLFYF